MREGRAVEELILTGETLLSHPATGATLWAESFLARSDGRMFLVLIDGQGQAAYAPDFSRQALDDAARQAGVSADGLQIGASEVMVLPFSHRFVWTAKLLAVQGGAMYMVTYDLAGRPVDFYGMQAAEEDARAAQCGKLDTSLCRQILDRDDGRLYAVEIYLVEGQSAAAVETLIAQGGYPYTGSQRSVAAKLPKPMILAVGALDEVARVNPQCGTILEIDSPLAFTLEEVGGDFTLSLSTAKRYGCLMSLAASLTRPAADRLTVTLRGIDRRCACADAIGPATAGVSLGQLTGVYELIFELPDAADRWRLTVTAEELRLEPLTQSFTFTPYLTWRRLPADSVWFVTSLCEDLGEPTWSTPVAPDRAVYDAAVEAFLADVERAGAEPLALPEGAYVHSSFIAPWPTWWETTGDRSTLSMRVHDWSWSGYTLRWPVVRYFRYAGPVTALQAAIDGHASSQLCLQAHTWTGEVLYAGR